METHKGPPYITFVRFDGFFILTALETNKASLHLLCYRQISK